MNADWGAYGSPFFMPLRVVILSLGLLLGLLFRFLEGAPEIGKGVANVNKCRFSLFSDRKNDTYFIDTHYIYSAKHLIYSCFCVLLPWKCLEKCVRASYCAYWVI